MTKKEANELASRLSKMSDDNVDAKSELASALWTAHLGIAYKQSKSTTWGFNVDDLTGYLYMCIYECTHGYDKTKSDYLLWLTCRYKSYLQAQYRYGGHQLIHTPVPRKASDIKQTVNVISVHTKYPDRGDTVENIIADDDTLPDDAYEVKEELMWFKRQVELKYPSIQRTIDDYFAGLAPQQDADVHRYKRIQAYLKNLAG